MPLFLNIVIHTLAKKVRIRILVTSARIPWLIYPDDTSTLFTLVEGEFYLVEIRSHPDQGCFSRFGSGSCFLRSIMTRIRFFWIRVNSVDFYMEKIRKKKVKDPVFSLRWIRIRVNSGRILNPGLQKRRCGVVNNQPDWQTLPT